MKNEILILNLIYYITLKYCRLQKYFAKLVNRYEGSEFFNRTQIAIRYEMGKQILSQNRLVAF